MPYPQKPQGLYVVNGWYLELPGLVSPHFETLEGLSKKTGTVDIVDAGTNIRYKFNGQIIDFGQITLTRTMDGTIDDISMRTLVEASIRQGVKYAGALVKMHFGNEVYRILFDGLGFKEENYPTFDINAEEKQQISYVATVDSWIMVP